MNKSKLIAEIAGKTKQTKASTEKIVEAFLDVVKEALQRGEEVQFIGFGKFIVVERQATKGLNPRTREEINIPASRQAKFRPGKILKDALNVKDASKGVARGVKKPEVKGRK